MKIAFRKKCHTIYAKIICFWTFGKYSHSELVFSDGTTFSSDEADGGTRWKDELEKPEEWDFIDIPCNKTQEKEIRRFCEGEDGLKYDMAGIGFSFLPIPIGWQSAEKWFCSEICAAALQQIGYLVGYTPSRISPNKLYSLLKSERRFRIKSLPLSLVALLLLVSTGAYAGWEGFYYGNANTHTCEYEKVTRLMNEGDTACNHDWVYEPESAPSAINAVYCVCGCPNEGRNKICRKCLRKVNERIEGRMVSPQESGYSKLNRLIEGVK